MTDPRLQDWLLRREEGDLTPRELEEFSELLSRDPAARQALRFHSMMTSGIHESLATKTKNDPFVLRRRRLSLVAIAAAVLLGLLLAVVLARKSDPTPIALPNPAPVPAPPALVLEQPRPSPEEPKAGPVPAPAPPSAVSPPPPAPTPEVPKPPPPEPKPEPREEQPAPPAQPDPKSAPAPTLAVLAKLERVSGSVSLGKAPAKAPQDIFTGQGLETGPGAEAVVLFRDQTRLSLSADARVAEFADRRVAVARGTVAIDLMGAFTVETPQAEIRGAGGAYFLVTSDAETTRVEVGAGKIRLARLSDGRAVEVSAGQTANASELAARALVRQDKKKKSKKDLEFDFKVNSAIQSGVNFLKEEADKATLSPLPDGGFPVELALWALQRGGLPESDPVFQKLFEHMTTAELQRTYRVALQAMILEELDRVKYQARIYQCAQFLVDNQARNGQWSYGEVVLPSDPVATPGKVKKDVATPGKTEPKGDKPKVLQKLPVAKRRDGPAQGDNSNSQYAVLGLRACYDAGIVLPTDVLKKAQSWWRSAQESTKKLEAAGWTYGEAASAGGRASYGSMTAGAAGSLVLYHYMLGEPWVKDDAVLKGMEWLTGHFTVTENPGLGDAAKNNEGYSWHYYYLYALERFGILFGTDLLGVHDWYLEGAAYLLKNQAAAGSWSAKPGDGFLVHDTCFAILFLRRATRPLNNVSSVDRNSFK